VSSDRVRVVITGAGTSTCLSVVKGLRKQTVFPVKIVTCDASVDVAGRYLSDKFYQVPFADDPNFVPALLEICSQERADILIPIVDAELEALSSQTRRFDEVGTTVLVSSQSAVSTCLDKYALFLLMQKHNLPMPDTWLLEKFEQQTFPVVLKPRKGRGSLGVFLAHDKTEYEYLVSKIRTPYIVQKMLTGREVTIDALCDTEGRFLGCCVRERIQVKAGQSFKGKTIKNTEVEEATSRLIEALSPMGAIGPFCIQGFITKKGFYFTEANPRFGAATVLSVYAGFNSPAAAVAMCVGIAPQQFIQNIETGVMMLRYWQEVFVSKGGKVAHSMEWMLRGWEVRDERTQ